MPFARAYVSVITRDGTEHLIPNEELSSQRVENWSHSHQLVRQRMAMATGEVSHWHEYDYIIINHEVEDSVASAQAILDAERLQRDPGRAADPSASDKAILDAARRLRRGSQGDLARFVATLREEPAG